MFFIHLSSRKRFLDNEIHIALESSPEVFASVTMLYINCKINGHPVKAFIDSGAQRTIMSEACAKRCGLMNKVDIRYRSLYTGVGEETSLGRIFNTYIEIEGVALDVCINPFYVHACLYSLLAYKCCLLRRHNNDLCAVRNGELLLQSNLLTKTLVR